MRVTQTMVWIMLALADGDRHGYAIMQDVTAVTGGEVQLGPGTLYGAIKRMVETGLITETDGRPAAEFDDERRRYYRLTPSGCAALAAEIHRLERTVSVAHARGAVVVSGGEVTA